MQYPENQITSVDVEVLTSLFDTVSDVAFFVKDSEARYVTLNDSLVERFRLASRSEAIGKKVREISEGELGEVPTEQDEEVLRTGQALIDHLEMHWSKRNEPVWCVTTKLPIRNDEGEIVGIVGFSRDVRVPVANDLIPKGLATALKNFEETLSSNLTASVLAQQSDVTSQQLLRLTKRVFDLTPSQVITKIRIAAASQMLVHTDKPVAEIASTCGFYDHSAFTRAFRNATNVTPSAFRAEGKTGTA